MNKIFIIIITTLLLSACSQPEGEPAIEEYRFTKNLVKVADISSDASITMLVDDNSACVFDNNTKKEISPCVTGDILPLVRRALLSDNKDLFFLTDGYNVFYFDVNTGQQIGHFETQNYIISSISYAHDAKILWLGTRTGELLSYNLNKKILKVFKNHNLIVNTIATTPNSSLVVSGSSDKYLILSNGVTGERIKSIKHRTRVNYVTINNQANVGFSADAISHKNFFTLPFSSLNSELDTIARYIEINDSKFSNDNKLFLTVSPKKTIQLWDIKSGNLVSKWESANAGRLRTSVLTAAFIDNSHIATVTSDGIYQVWKLPNSK